jgi:glyoxalase family protein
VCSGPQHNANFYRGVLGLRMVKATVHFDNARVYHLYYGDEIGTPGTLITFFPFADLRSHGRHGAGSIAAIQFAVPEHSAAFWSDRLRRRGVSAGKWHERFGEPVLELEDPDGLRLEVVATPAARGRTSWTGSDVPAADAVRGIRGATISVRRPDPSIAMLTRFFGLSAASEEDGRTRLVFARDTFSTHLDVVHNPDGPDALPVPLEGVLPEVGTVNHLAFGPVGAAEQLNLREQLASAGFPVTPVKDRRYFKSIYTLDPAGIRLEAATGEPGFLVDEPRDLLGTALQLPPWLEAQRAEYQRLLPALDFNLPVR